MAEIKDGGPAFPTGTFADEGMSLRDWFAGQALASGQCEGDCPDSLAELCYRIADAMLKARETRS